MTVMIDNDEGGCMGGVGREGDEEGDGDEADDVEKMMKMA